MENDIKRNNPWIISENNNKITNSVPILVNIRKIYQSEITNILKLKNSELTKRYLKNNMDWYPKYTLEIQI